MVDGFGELRKVGVERRQQALESAPTNVSPAALDTRQIRSGEVGAYCQLVLCEPGSGSERAYRASDVGLSGTYHIVKVARRRVAAQNIVGARADGTAGRRGTGSANSRRSKHPTDVGTVFFSPRAVLSEPPHNHWRTDMTTITIPARIVRYLREALHSQLGMAAEDISRASHEGGRRQPVLYADPLAQFDRIRTLLDLIGWKDETEERPAIVNLVPHRAALLAALQMQLETERNMANDDPSLKGAEKQIACARRRVDDLEQFLALASVSLKDPE